MDYIVTNPISTYRNISSIDLSNRDSVVSNQSTYEAFKIALLLWVRRMCILLTVTFYGSECFKIHTDKSTEGHSVIPLLTGILNGGLWFNYAIITNNKFTLIASTICYTLNCLYVVIFNAYTENKEAVSGGVKLVLTTLSTAVLYTWQLPRQQGRQRAGEFANIVSILLSSSPLIHLKEVYETNSNHSMPIAMIVIGFISSILYVIYGWLINDVYIMRPNGISGIVSGFLLVVFYIYSK